MRGDVASQIARAELGGWSRLPGVEMTDVEGDEPEDDTERFHGDKSNVY